jgi:hypothetical protein
MTPGDNENYARIFLMDAILCGTQSWTKARVKTLEAGIKNMPKEVGDLKREFLLAKVPAIPLTEDGGLDVVVAKLLLVATAARGGYWHEFIDKIRLAFGRAGYVSVIIGFKEAHKYFRLCADDRFYIMSELIHRRCFEDEIADFVNSSYFASTYNSPKIKYIKALGANKCYKTLGKFAKSRAEYVLVELAMQFPVEELIYHLNTKSDIAKAIIEKRLHEVNL